MRLLTYAADHDAKPGALGADGLVVDVRAAAARAGIDGGSRIDVAAICGMAHSARARIEAAVENAPADLRVSVDAVRLLPPVPRPGKIVCLAGNYREHIVESGFAAVAAQDVITPQMFLKPATCLIGARDDIPLARRNRTVGWEVELAVVIGGEGRDISEADAWRHVFGYTVLNDVSERAVNVEVAGRRVRERDPFFDWLAGKWFDGFAPCGPWIVTPDEVPDPHALDLRLLVNGEIRQDGSTRDMIFRIPRLVAEISSIMTLEPGDLIATGTPAGAGTGTGEAFLRAGDEVVCEVAGIGTLRNRVARGA